MGFIDDLKRLARPYEDEEDMDGYEDDFEDTGRSDFSERKSAPKKESASFNLEPERRSNKVVNIHTTTQLQVAAGQARPV